MDEELPLFEFDPDPVGVLDQWVTLAAARDSIPPRAVLCFYAEILSMAMKKSPLVAT